jgi:hypothetical protein
MVNATSVSFMLAPDSRFLTTKVVVTGFHVRETITINVDFPGSYPDKRYHDWLGPIKPGQGYVKEL